MDANYEGLQICVLQLAFPSAGTVLSWRRRHAVPVTLQLVHESVKPGGY